MPHTHTTMLDAHPTIFCFRVLGFHRLITSEHSTHTHYDAQRSPQDFVCSEFWVCNRVDHFSRELFFPDSSVSAVFSYERGPRYFIVGYAPIFQFFFGLINSYSITWYHKFFLYAIVYISCNYSCPFLRTDRTLVYFSVFGLILIYVRIAWIFYYGKFWKKSY